jgi:chromosomal replication initiation ATPase DnaA
MTLKQIESEIKQELKKIKALRYLKALKLQHDESQKITADMSDFKIIIEIVCEVRKISEAALRGRRGQRHVSDSRFIAFMVTSEVTRLTHMDMATYFERHISAPCQAIRTGKQLIACDAAFKKDYEAVKAEYFRRKRETKTPQCDKTL